VLQRISVCCNVVKWATHLRGGGVLCVAECESALQCIKVCCSGQYTCARAQRERHVSAFSESFELCRSMLHVAVISEIFHDACMYVRDVFVLDLCLCVVDVCQICMFTAHDHSRSVS